MSKFFLLVAACVGLALLSLPFASAPTYDPWAWLVWGREIAGLDLDTERGPSWKPLPVLFTTVFSLAGDAAPALWLAVARAGGFFALAAAYRLARKLAGETGGVVAGALAALALLLTPLWVRHVGGGKSEGLLVALVLFAVERHIEGKRAQAFALGCAAALLRPEVWPFLGLYAVFLWRAEPRRRPLVVALISLVPVLWFVPDLVGSGEPFRSAGRARDPSRQSLAYAEEPALGVFRLMENLLLAPVEAGFVVAVAFAVAGFASGKRRDAATLVLAGAAVITVVTVAGLTEAGYSGNARYLLLPAALASVLAGVGWARLVQAGVAVAARASPKLVTAVRTGLPLLLLAGALAFALPHAAALKRPVQNLEFAGDLYGDLESAVSEAGRAGVLECGTPYTGRFHTTALAWHLGAHLSEIEFEPRPPGVVFRAPPTPGSDPSPAIPPSTPRFLPVASAGAWDVLATCSPE